MILNSAGRASIWLQNRAYKIELRNSANVTIWTVDNVQDWGQVLKRDLADTTSDSLNSALIGFKAPSGSPTTVRQKLIDLSAGQGYDVSSYGAVCNGTTDDRAAIQSAIDAAAAAGVAVIIPSGKSCAIAGPLIMRTGSKVYCNGLAADASGKPTEIKSSSSWSKTTGDALITNDQSTFAWGSTITGCKITGNSTSGPDYGIYYKDGNILTLEDILVNKTKLDGIYLDTSSTPGRLFQSAFLKNVTVYDAVLNTGLTTRHGAIRIDWTDVNLVNTGGYTSSEASYSQGGKRIGCLFGPNSANGAMVNSECSHSEVGLRIESFNWKIATSRAQFNAGNGVEVTGYGNSFASFQSQFNGRSVGTFYGIYVTGTGNSFTAVRHDTQCPDAGGGTVNYAMRFEATSAPVNSVNGFSGNGCLGPYSASLPAFLMWNLEPRSGFLAGVGAIPFVGTFGIDDRTPRRLLVQSLTNETRLGVGSEIPITVTAATKANPMVITLASSAPADWVAGRYVMLTGGTFADGNPTNIQDDPCWHMNQPLQISSGGGTSWTLSYDNSTCNYKASSATAFLAPVDGLTVGRTGGASGTVASVGIRGRVAQFYMQDKRALPTSTNAGTWKWYTNFDEASQTYNEYILSGINDADSSESRAMLIARDPAATTIKRVDFPTGYVTIGDNTGGDSSANNGVLQIKRSMQWINGLAFAALPAGGVHVVWCTDCNIATPCTGGGAGAWAFRSGGTWKCPF